MTQQTIPQPDVTTATIGAEQAADLGALQSLVNDGEQATTEATAAAGAIVAVNQVNELKGILFSAGTIVAMKYPSLKTVYTDARCQEVAEQLNPVFEKLGWNISGGDFAIYAVGLYAVYSIGADTKKAVAADIEAQRIEAENKQKEEGGVRQS